MKNEKGELELAPEAKKLAAAVEGRSKAIMKALGCDDTSTFNIDRIMRLPGTINLPTKVKLEKGYVECSSALLASNGGEYALDVFPEPEPEPEPTAAKGADNIDLLPISSRMKNLIRGIDDPEHPYRSRSERVMAVLIAMASAGCSHEQFEAIFLDQRYPIAAHVLDQPKPSEYLAKHIKKFRKLAVDPRVASLNESYALVLVGDKAAVMNTSVAEGIRMLTVSAFKQWLANQYVPFQDKKGDEKRIPLADYWLQHKQRRQYEGIVFAPQRDEPDHYNLWRGFAVEPRPGDCSKFLAHLKENVCQGKEGLFAWTVGWFAQIVQRSDVKMGTSLVLRGEQGTGKTKVGEVFGSVIGEHYALVSDPRYVTGRFNSHLVSCLLLHCDEAFWAGDKAAEGKLKDLITGHHQFIEFKGKEAIRISNYVRLLVTGNADWQVPAGFGERRFAVLDVGEAQMQNHAYFAAIDEQMNNGGREALLHHLLNFDLSSVNLREIPQTTALVEQKLSTLTAEQGWWLDTLTRGELSGGCTDEGCCPVRRLFDDYIKHAQKQGVRRRSIETQLGIFLRKHVPGLRRVEGTYDLRDRGPYSKAEGTEGYVYVLPPLAECRAAFAKALQSKIQWPEGDTWKTRDEDDQWRM